MRSGLGLTRDPYLMVADTNMWINVGRSQFHLPTGKPQVVRGHTGLVIAGRAALLDRLTRVKPRLEGTRFGFAEHNDYVEAICPWGNRMRVYEPDAERFGRIALGIPYVEFDVPVGTAKAIAAFYPAVFGTPASVQNGDGTVARTLMGKDQYLQFRETDVPQPDSTAITCRCTSRTSRGPYEKLKARNLISMEDNQYQWRFQDIVDLDSGKVLFSVEHEVRSVTHPMYLRPLVNRNPGTTNQNYANGYDSALWAMDPEQYDARGDAAAELGGRHLARDGLGDLKIVAARARLQSVDHAEPILRLAVLAHLPFAFEPRDLEAEADDAAQSSRRCSFPAHPKPSTDALRCAPAGRTAP